MPGRLGFCEVNSLKLSTGEDLFKKIEYIHPDDDNADDQTVMRVPLPQSVGPGASVALDIVFTAQLGNGNEKYTAEAIKAYTTAIKDFEALAAKKKAEAEKHRSSGPPKRRPWRSGSGATMKSAATTLASESSSTPLASSSASSSRRPAPSPSSGRRSWLKPLEY
jgi:hypothetical protein